MNRYLEGIAAVFFDAVGTLIFPSPPVTCIYGEVAQQFGGRDPDPIELREQFLRSFSEEEQRDIEADWRTSEEWEIARWRRIVTSCLPDVTDAEAAFQALFSHFALPSAWRLHPEAPEVFQVLRERAFIIGMGSNYDSRLQQVVAGHDILRDLDYLLISSFVGWRKPSPHFFEAIIQQSRIPPHRILFIGDDRRNDFEGARAVGMRSILLDPNLDHPSIEPRIRSLKELID